MPDLYATFRNLDDKKLLAICLYGEARGEAMGGKVGVASVIMNRVKKGKWFGDTVQKVILKPKQFSCFNGNDPNRITLVLISQNWDIYYKKYKALQECYYVAEKVIDGDLKDSVSGATHYKTKKCKVAWADKMKLMAVIGNHEFYLEE